MDTTGARKSSPRNCANRPGFSATKRIVCALAVLVAASMPTVATANPDPDADTILIRQDCTGLGNNCFTSIDQASGWTNLTRVPTPLTPLFWDIGPGVFNGTIDCSSVDSVTYRGRGPGVTTIVGPANGTAFRGATCDGLTIQDMTFYSNSWYTVHWSSGGSATWTNVHLINESFSENTRDGNAWYDDCGAGSEQAVHYMFGSRVESRGMVSDPGPNGAIHAPVALLCSQMWIYGSDIVRDFEDDDNVADNGPLPPSNRAITAAIVFLGEYGNAPGQPDGDARLFGTTLRARIGSGYDGSTIFGVFATDDSVAHVHGGIINLTASPDSGTVELIGVAAGGSSFAHVVETPFTLKPDDLPAKRVFGDGVRSAYVWQASTVPPTLSSETGEFGSVDGQDMFVETDCGPTGDCATGGSEPHLMIYSSACAQDNPWFDVVTGACRQ